MTVFYLVRHGDNDSVGHGISGRRDGIYLNGRGRAQARAVATRLADLGVTHVYSSPLERTRETAGFIATRLGLDVEIVPELNEIAFGDWTGRSFTELDSDTRWRRFNRVRSITRVPGGEMMIEVQARMVTALERLRQDWPEAKLVIVSHGDPIRLAIAYYTGIPLDLLQNIHVDLGSVSTLAVDDHGVCLHCLNHTGHTPTG